VLSIVADVRGSSVVRALNSIRSKSSLFREFSLLENINEIDFALFSNRSDQLAGLCWSGR
jgi:hypothetical protein